MEHPLYNVCLLAVVVFLVQQVASYIKIWFFKREHGCKHVNKLPQFERLFGYDLYKSQINSFRDKKLLEVDQERYRQCGPTWSAGMMGQASIIIPRPPKAPLTPRDLL